MNWKMLRIAGLLCLTMLLMLYVADWVKSKPATKPNAATAVFTNALSLSLGTNAMSPAVRAGLQVALEHIRTEMGHTTNSNDLDNLREAEKTLTNVLARP